MTWTRESLPCCRRHCRTAGPYRSRDIAPLPRYRGPLRHPLAFRPFPRCGGYRAYLAPPLSRRDEEGFSSCSTRPGHRAVANHPARVDAASVSWRRTMLPSPKGCGLGLWGLALSRPPRAHFRYGPMTRSPSSDGFVDGLQGFGLPPPCRPATGLLTVTPVGLAPTEHVSLSWTHNLECRSLADWDSLEMSLRGLGRAWRP